MDTCTVETGLLRKKPCGKPSVTHCANCEQALCKDHGTSLLLSATTAKAQPEAQLVAVGDITVRGFAEPVTVFSIPAVNVGQR